MRIDYLKSVATIIITSEVSSSSRVVTFGDERYSLKSSVSTSITWEKDFLTEGAMRGIWWAVLYYDVPAGKLFNVWVNEHDVGHLSGAVPILVIDVFEHAFMLDYGLKRADYLTVFIRAVDWDEAEKRFSKAV